MGQHRLKTHNSTPCPQGTANFPRYKNYTELKIEKMSSKLIILQQENSPRHNRAVTVVVTLVSCSSALPKLWFCFIAFFFQQLWLPFRSCDIPEWNWTATESRRRHDTCSRRLPAMDPSRSLFRNFPPREACTQSDSCSSSRSLSLISCCCLNVVEKWGKNCELHTCSWRSSAKADEAKVDLLSIKKWQLLTPLSSRGKTKSNKICSPVSTTVNQRREIYCFAHCQNRQVVTRFSFLEFWTQNQHACSHPSWELACSASELFLGNSPGWLFPAGFHKLMIIFLPSTFERTLVHVESLIFFN